MKEVLIEKKANAFRAQHALDASAPLNLRSLLARLNVLTVFRPMGDGFSGMAVKVAEGGVVSRFMLVNANNTLGKQHFTICHELYHLFVQESFEMQVCATGLFKGQKDKEELNADLFAAHLLMPEEGLLAMIPEEELKKKDGIQLSTLVKLEQFFSCSRSALLYRLKSLGFIGKELYEAYGKQVKLSAVQRGYNTALYEPAHHGLVIGDYGSLARELYDQERISESHYHSLLMDIGVSPELIEQAKDE